LGKAYTYLRMVSRTVFGVFACISIFFGFLLLGLSADLYLPYLNLSFDAVPYQAPTSGTPQPGSALCRSPQQSTCTPSGAQSAQTFQNNRFGYIRGIQGNTQTVIWISDFFWWPKAGVAFVMAGVVSILASFGKAEECVVPMYWFAFFFNLMAFGWGCVCAAYNVAGPDPIKYGNNANPQYVATTYFYTGCHRTSLNQTDPNGYSCSAGDQVSAAISFAFINMAFSLVMVCVLSCGPNTSSGSSGGQKSSPPPAQPKSTETAETAA